MQIKGSYFRVDAILNPLEPKHGDDCVPTASVLFIIYAILLSLETSYYASNKALARSALPFPSTLLLWHGFWAAIYPSTRAAFLSDPTPSLAIRLDRLVGRIAKGPNLIGLYPPTILAIAQGAVALARALQTANSELSVSANFPLVGLDPHARTAKRPARQGSVGEAARLLEYGERGGRRSRRLPPR